MNAFIPADERSAIADWFADRRRSGATLTSPLTNEVLESDRLLPNHALRKQCEAFAASIAKDL